jgi:hypothetical protein
MDFVEYLRGDPPTPSCVKLGEITHHYHSLVENDRFVFFHLPPNAPSSCRPTLPPQYHGRPPDPVGEVATALRRGRMPALRHSRPLGLNGEVACRLAP